jgi:hypothetical protein
MRDTELYRQRLGLESTWTVTRVELAGDAVDRVRKLECQPWRNK